MAYVPHCRGCFQSAWPYYRVRSDSSTFQPLGHLEEPIHFGVTGKKTGQFASVCGVGPTGRTSISRLI